MGYWICGLQTCVFGASQYCECERDFRHAADRNILDPDTFVLHHRAVLSSPDRTETVCRAGFITAITVVISCRPSGYHPAVRRHAVRQWTE